MGSAAKYLPIFLGVVSIAGVFGVGSYFDLFGRKIDFAKRPETYLFFGMIYLGVFGVASSMFRYQTAFKAMVVVAALTFGLFIVGQYARGELW